MIFLTGYTLFFTEGVSVVYSDCLNIRIMCAYHADLRSILLAGSFVPEVIERYP